MGKPNLNAGAKVWLVIDDAPAEWGEKRVVSVHKTQAGAKLRIARAMRRAPYVSQYFTVVERRLGL